MEFLQESANNGSIDTAAIAEYLNSEPVTDAHYYVTACAGCHGNDGSGGRSGESVMGEDAGDIREAINDESAMRYLACLPDADIEAMARFLAGGDGGVDTNDGGTNNDGTNDGGTNDAEDEEDDADTGGGGSGDLPMLVLLAALALLRSGSRGRL
jgi:mono/diheme cytochrome c family protein